jgi:TRAP transporter 4TM/12TM fusion protein
LTSRHSPDRERNGPALGGLEDGTPADQSPPAENGRTTQVPAQAGNAAGPCEATWESPQREQVVELATRIEGERPARRLGPRIDALITVCATGVAALVLWQVFRPLPQGSQFYLVIFLAGILPLVFLGYPAGLRAHRGGDTDPESELGRAPGVTDHVLAALAVVVCLYPVLPVSPPAGSGGYDAFLSRAGTLTTADVVAGGLLLVLVLEAVRRSTGWVLAGICLLFLAYDYYGGLLPQSWDVAHAGLDFDQIVDALYNSGSGFYGTPLDVAASYIVLFTIYGAVLDLSGAGTFFVGLTVAAFRRSRSAAGRTAVASGFLLGTVSGSGAATTVSVGSITWPILKAAGYPPARAGGMLAAAGVGAMLSPPTLGAAAFIIAEYLQVSYLTVLGWALIPTVLYYLGILLAVEIDARRFGARAVAVAATSPWRLLARFGYHFSSLIAIVVLLAVGQPATRAVVYATALAVLLSFLDRRHRMTPRRMVQALSAGVRGVLPVAAVCAAAGVITISTTKTGLGPQLGTLLIKAAQGLASDPAAVLALTAVFAALALVLLGTAVPVTASFIIGWVIVGPAMLDLSVTPPEVAMFVFYFAVLSEATPPTALAAVAASALTGGPILATMWQTLRYTLPAFLVPLAFVVTPVGEGLLGFGGVGQVAYAVLTSALGVAALAVATGGWLPPIGPAGWAERLLAAVGGVVLLWLTPATTAVGSTLIAAAVITSLIRRRIAAAPERQAT